MTPDSAEGLVLLVPDQSQYSSKSCPQQRSPSTAHPPQGAASALRLGEVPQPLRQAAAGSEFTAALVYLPSLPTNVKNLISREKAASTLKASVISLRAL